MERKLVWPVVDEQYYLFEDFLRENVKGFIGAEKWLLELGVRTFQWYGANFIPSSQLSLIPNWKMDLRHLTKWNAPRMLRAILLAGMWAGKKGREIK